MGYEHIHNAVSGVLYMKDDIYYVSEDVVMCDYGHPISYIKVPEGEPVTCAYCERKFRRKC